tara:strand:+ start:1639 stop:3054 length:1416 start_codon:yes stop_codon:yes gene_type:complete
MKFQNTISQQVLNKIKSKKWYRHGIYRDNLLLASTYLRFLGTEYMKKEGIEKGMSNNIRLGDGSYVVEEEFTQLVKLFYEKISIPFLKKYIMDYNKDNEHLMGIAKQINKEDAKILSDKEIAKNLQLFFKNSNDIFHWLWGMEYLNTAMEQFMHELTKKWKPSWNNEQITNFLDSVSYIPKKFRFQKEKEDILNNISIETLHKKYEWRKMNTWDARPYSLEEYRKRALKIKEQEIKQKSLETMEKGADKAKKIISSIDNQEVREYTLLLQDLIFLKTNRIDILTQSFYLIQPLLNQISKRKNVKYEDLIKSTQEEIIQLTQNIKPDLSNKDYYAIVRIEDEMHFFYGPAYKTIQEVLENKELSKLTSVKGSTAFKGKVTGNVKILLTDRDLPKLEKGDILVCNLTNPNYNPAFNLVKGIVTDGGGILCHSAIMAREFKIPCVIGTKYATFIFKDNELIEVDANKGTVTKLK